MLQASFDAEARTLYVYFTLLQEGQAVAVLEYPAALLLDAQGRLVALQLELDDEVTLAQLDLVLDGDYDCLNMSSGVLFVALAESVPVERVPLVETAILDLDADDTILGIEIVLPPPLATPETLAALVPILVPLDEPEAALGDGPVVFIQPEVAPADLDAVGPGEAASADLDAVAPARVAPVDPDADVFPTLTPAPALEADAHVPASTADPAPPHAATLAAAASGSPEPLPNVPADFRSGFVALVGKPNVGKSTLLNALLGQKVAIVSPQPQTTRVPLRGILNRPHAQIIFVDTPGIHKPNHALGRMMVDMAERTLPNADVIGFMVDISQPPSQLDRQIATQVQRVRGHAVLILNKVDLQPRKIGESYLEAYRALGSWELEMAISAQRGLGLDSLIEAFEVRLPPGPPLYPDDQVTDQNEQHLAAEFVREKVLYHTQQEVPHAVAVEVDEWEPRDNGTYIRMTINVEREGQKAIVIGGGGAMLKKIGTAARYEIERMLGHQVFLDLWVKVRPNWRDDANALNWLGYRKKDWK
ncbi:GTPase Era [Candidatus Chloroploca mongolica]|nr:GTPase Era [Candidatus Chloroploca mongolica]